MYGRALSICNLFLTHLRNTIETEKVGGRIYFKLSCMLLNTPLGLLGTFLPPSAAMLHSSTLQRRNTKTRKDSNSDSYSNLSLISHSKKEKAYGRLRGSVPAHNTL